MIGMIITEEEVGGLHRAHESWSCLLYLYHTLPAKDFVVQYEVPATLNATDKDVECASNLVGVVPPHAQSQYYKLATIAVVRTTAKALLLTLVNQETGELIDIWFPKSVCRNLNLIQGSVLVWEEFIQKNFPQYGEFLYDEDKNSGE